jgi:hypothetical protein
MRTTLRLRAVLFTACLLAGCRQDSDQVTGNFQSPLFARSDPSEAAATWSAAVNLGSVVNSAAQETSPSMSPDGLSLYFVSLRPGGLGGADIWISHRASLDSAWETPVNAGAPINSSSEDSHPAFSPDGHLLFVSSNRPGGQGLNDIYVSHRIHTHDDFNWETPVVLGPDVNTELFDAAPTFAPGGGDGGATFYFSHGPVNTNLDIYSVAITRDGETLSPAELVAELSAASPSSDAHPSLSKDGKEVVFYSTRPGGAGAADIWTSTRQNSNAPWSVPVGIAAINTVATDIHPTLSLDGQTLLFASNRAGGTGDRDLYISTRLPK